MNSKQTQRNIQNKSRIITDLTHDEVQAHFLKTKSYCGFDLPKYFNFGNLLDEVSHAIKSHDNLGTKGASNHQNVNYTVLHNKNGKYAWRPLQLIHPVLYVLLVNAITNKNHWETISDRFKEFAENSEEIECISIPRESLTNNSDKAEQISNWWHEIEQRSIALALEYKHITHTDITDCYGSIYTHSIAWAFHGKDFIKEANNRHNLELIGNIIDQALQNMAHSQTNGIPQGSSLMDFIAEMVLGYADSELLKKLRRNGNIKNKYKILRYRDDYRIFSNHLSDHEYIMKTLTEVMVGLGLKLNPEKTKVSHDVITSAIKNDKIYWMQQKQADNNLQKYLLNIRELAIKYPNSGSIETALKDFYDYLRRKKKNNKLIENNNSLLTILVSIVVDIAYTNPRTYPYTAAILSFLLDLADSDAKQEILNKVIDKFNDIPHTSHLMIWLQRIVLGIQNQNNDFGRKSKTLDNILKEPLCKIAVQANHEIWNNYWIVNKKFKQSINFSNIIYQECIKNLPAVISRDEVKLFNDRYDAY